MPGRLLLTCVAALLATSAGRTEGPLARVGETQRPSTRQYPRVVPRDPDGYATKVLLAEDVELSLYTPTMIRVRHSALDPDDAFPAKYEIPFAIGHLRPWAPVPFELLADERGPFVETETLRIRFDPATQQWSVEDRAGVRIHPSDAPIYGLFRGGYSLFDSASAFGETNRNSRYAHWFYNENTGRYVDTYLAEDAIDDRFFIYGPDYPAIDRQFNQLVGPEPLLAKKHYGFFQTQHLACRGDQEQLMAVAKRLRADRIPADTLIIDFEWGDGCDGTTEVTWGSRLDWSSSYTQPRTPAAMIEELKRLHFDVMLIHHSVPEFPNRYGQGWTESTAPERRWWDAMEDLLAIGVRGTWQDTRRNDLSDSVIWSGLRDRLAPRRVLYMGARKMMQHNPWDRTFDQIPVNQVIGGRRYPFDWTGDVDSSWAELAWQIRAITGAHGALRGIGYLTYDSVGATPAIQARMNQFVDFLEVSRSHNLKPWEVSADMQAWAERLRIDRDAGRGSTDPPEAAARVARERESVEQSIRRHRRLRYRLLPYIYSYAHESYRTGMPLTRPMLLAFPDDAQCNAGQWPYQYMFGRELLIAPVYGDFSTMEIYLPEGSAWIDYWNETEYTGGQLLRYDVSEVGRLPIFVRGGAIVPMRRDQEWIDPAPDEELIVHLYPAGDGAFTLVDDDGETTAYQRGELATTDLVARWRAAQIEIEVAAMVGQFTGRPTRRRYELVVHGFDRAPAADRVLVQGGTLDRGSVRYDSTRRQARLTVEAATDTGLRVVIPRS